MLTILPLNFNGSLAKHGLTSLINPATSTFTAQKANYVERCLRYLYGHDKYMIYCPGKGLLHEGSYSQIS